jgi:1,4-alpha-glucan branching enzyme
VPDPGRFPPTLGELDLYLIAEGRHERLWEVLGARPLVHAGVAGTRFAVWAPNARAVALAGDFNDWDAARHPLRRLGAGVWETFVPDAGPGARYVFEVTGADGVRTRRADPLARRTEPPRGDVSVVHADRYAWGDADWLARRAAARPADGPLSVYELHPASWRPGLTWRGLAAELPEYVTSLGFTHVELMPPAEHPYGGSWGYQVTGHFAPTSRLGPPEDFKLLVDALHRAGVGVLLDWVPAHFPRDAWALARFDGTPAYEHADPRRADHPDWGTLVFDHGRPQVRNFLVAAALFWCEEYHVDGLRVDAVASMLYRDYSRGPGAWLPGPDGGREDWEAVAFLRELNDTVHGRWPGVLTIAEESTAWDGVTRATADGGLGFDLKWNMGWMHDSLVYVARDPVHRAWHHREITHSLTYAHSERFVLPLSHDEVVHGKRALVNKMPGDWAARRAGLRAYLGFMWAHPGKQLLFMGQEFAQGSEWSDAEGPQWWVLDAGWPGAAGHAGVRELVRDLNGTYRAVPALWERDADPAGFEWLVADAADDNVLAFWRHPAGDGPPLLAVCNFSGVSRLRYRLGVPEWGRAFREVLNTDAARYGGGGLVHDEPLKAEAEPAHGRPASVVATLPALSTVWFLPA